MFLCDRWSVHAGKRWMNKATGREAGRGPACGCCCEPNAVVAATTSRARRLARDKRAVSSLPPAKNKQDSLSRTQEDLRTRAEPPKKALGRGSAKILLRAYPMPRVIVIRRAE